MMGGRREKYEQGVQERGVIETDPNKTICRESFYDKTRCMIKGGMSNYHVKFLAAFSSLHHFVFWRSLPDV